MLNNGSHRPAITVSLAVHMHSLSKLCPKNGFAPLRWKRRVINVPLSNKINERVTFTRTKVVSWWEMKHILLILIIGLISIMTTLLSIINKCTNT